MPTRPTSAASDGHQRKALVGSNSQQPLQGKLRPQSAALVLKSPSSHALTSSTHSRGAAGLAQEKVGASSEELIRDLESKVRKVVDLKRAESDKLRFAVTKKREEVEKAKLILQDLIKDCEALGLHYNHHRSTQNNNQTEGIVAVSDCHTDNGCDGLTINVDSDIVEENDRLQPISSISRRPVYTKHTKINELEAKLEKRAKEAHEVHRRSLVLEHIKKRLLSERADIVRKTDELKAQFTDLSHLTQELHKKDIVAAEAVNQVQTRLTQQKADMTANAQKYKREVALRQKWAREKAKFEKYYKDQVQSLGNQSTHQIPSTNGVTSAHSPAKDENGGISFQRAPRCGSPGIPRQCRRSISVDPADIEEQETFRDAFLRIGFGQHGEPIDPEEIIRTCLSHDDLKKELDAKHDENLKQLAKLRESIAKSRHVASEAVSLSRRGSTQQLETQELEFSAVERTLATAVDQYMFVDQAVRPIKACGFIIFIGLQQILQNVTNETVNIDNTADLEKALVGTCEEMMRLVRESNLDEDSDDNDSTVSELKNNQQFNDIIEQKSESALQPKGSSLFSAENFTSPFNVRIPPIQKEEYFVPGIIPQASSKAQDEDNGEMDFEVMDRATVKRISSVLICTSTGKKTREFSSTASSPAKAKSYLKISH